MLHRLLKQSGRGFAIAALTLLFAGPLLAQTGRIEGTVRDANTDDPVTGARVTVVGTQLSAETNENGYYAIENVAVGTYEVRVSVIGYQTVTITNQRVQTGLPTTTNFTLARSILRIEGVVVTGVAEATEAVKLPFTVDQVKGEDMPVVASNPEEMVRGKVAGATVVRGSGRPGSGVSVMLRGATSLLRSNEPLYVVDGVILGASMVDIDALNIESMEVVKGASAAALYGSRAANGVISIQTRRGRGLPEGETRVTVRSEFGQNGMERQFPLTNSTHYKTSANGWSGCRTFLGGNSFDPAPCTDADTVFTFVDTTFNCDNRFAGGGAACAADGSEEVPVEISLTTQSELSIVDPRDLRVPDFVFNCLSTDPNGNVLGASDFDTDSDGDGTLDCRSNQYAVSDNPYPGTSTLYDHFALFIDPGSFYTNSISVAHRTGSTNFAATVGEGKEGGLIAGLNGYLRRTARLNIDHKIGNKLDFRASAFYGQSFADLEGDGFSDAANPFFSFVRLEPDLNLGERYPTSQAKIDAGTGTTRDTNDYIVYVPFVVEINPVYLAANQDDRITRGRFLGSFGMRWRPIDLIDLAADFSYDRSDRNTTQYWFKGYRTDEPSVLNTGRLRLENGFTQAINGGATATLTKDFGNLATVTRARVLIEREKNQFFSAQGTDLTVNDVEDLDNVPTADAAAETIGSSTSQIRALGYFLSTQWDLNDRYIIDALVRRDGSSLFGADERWNWYYRLGGAYRVSQEPWWPFSFLDEFKIRFSRGTAGNRPSFSSQYETYSVSGSGVSKAALGNRFLKPEHATENEFGVDMIIGGRASLSVSYANTNVEDQILPVPLPGFAGFSSQIQNAGAIRSRTLEATFQYSVIQSPDISWNWNVVWDRTRGTITRLDVPPFFLNAYHYLRAGDELGTLYGDKWATTCSDIKFGDGGATVVDGFYTGDTCLSANGGAFDLNDDGYLVPVGAGNAWTDMIDQNFGGASLNIDGVDYIFGRPVKGQIVRIDTLGFDAAGVAIEQVDTTVFQKIGNTAPKFNLGISQTFRYKGLSLYALVDGSFGGDIYNNTTQWGCRDQTCWQNDQRTQDGSLGSGDGSNPSAAKELDYMTVLYNVNDPNTHFVEDGTFVKLREVALRYTFGRSTLQGVLGGLMKRVSVSVIGRNLLTLTNYSGFDPEVSTQGSNSALLRVDAFGYPNFRTFTGSVEIEF